MPHTMKQLAWVQFFSWFALFAMWIYTTPAVTSHLYGTTRHRARRSTTRAPTGWASGSAPTTASRRSSPSAFRCWRGGPAARSPTRSASSAARSGCSRSSCSRTRGTCWGRMVGVGIAWASILAMPYAILTGSLPPSKMGYYMGVFNFFIVIPQIVAAALLGFLVGRFFGGRGDLCPRHRRRVAAARRRAHPPGARTRTTGEPATWHPGFPSSV